MEKFDYKINIIVKTSINKSEDIEKIKEAISNIIKLNYKIKENLIIADTSEYKSLDNLYNIFRNKQTSHIARKNLIRNIENNNTYILFNKQAAKVNSIVICENEDESPLGPIIVKITSNRIIEFIKNNFIY